MATVLRLQRVLRLTASAIGGRVRAAEGWW
jgi:hypothetical protein